MRARSFLLAAAVAFAGTGEFAAQNAQEPRRIYASKRPIVELLRPGERELQLRRLVIGEPVEIDPSKTFVQALVDFNPIIFTGRVVGKEPEFLDFGDARVLFRIVRREEATWIGSRLTMLIERVIQTTDELPLTVGGRLTFVVHYDGSATIDGTRVAAESDRLWPIEAGKRYLVTGTLEEQDPSQDKTFMASGMWLEPYDGGPLRGPDRRPLASNLSEEFETVPTFERDGMVPTNIFQTADRLQQAALERTKR